ncbi:kynurenine formamidase isoform X2 [Folsomia candida]|uniref:kynurenine formamidase isoform X2 n=1 Tax=Folsomia candida TaxID=158441 RepID=UPI00160539EE|nr:kynurenine formamidase isoform X2 [Folsomia candida]
MDTKAKKESGKLNIVDNDVDFWKIWESNPKELERQFAPIMWIVNKDKKETYDTHIKVSTIETVKARECVPCKLDVSYGNHAEKVMDIYGTDLPSSAPTLFFVHGGYWRSGKKSWSGPMVRNAYSWGVRTIVIDYPLAPQARLGTICNATQECLSYAMQMFPESTFVIAGHSAGAQLLLSLFHKIPGVMSISDNLKKRVAGAFLISPPYDMRPVIGIRSINKALQLKPS